MRDKGWVWTDLLVANSTMYQGLTMTRSSTTLHIDKDPSSLFRRAFPRTMFEISNSSLRHIRS
jgi:hypothetical protein